MGADLRLLDIVEAQAMRQSVRPIEAEEGDAAADQDRAVRAGFEDERERPEEQLLGDHHVSGECREQPPEPGILLRDGPGEDMFKVEFENGGAGEPLARREASVGVAQVEVDGLGQRLEAGADLLRAVAKCGTRIDDDVVPVLDEQPPDAKQGIQMAGGRRSGKDDLHACDFLFDFFVADASIRRRRIDQG